MSVGKFIGLWVIFDIMYVILFLMSFIFPPLGITIGLPAIAFMIVFNIGCLVAAIWIYVNNPAPRCISCWSSECSKSRENKRRRGEFYDPDYEDDDYSPYEDGYTGGFIDYSNYSSRNNNQQEFTHIGDSSFDTGKPGFNQNSMGYY